MATSKSGSVNGPLWGARVDDWAAIQEPMGRPMFEAALERAGVGREIRYLDNGCGAGHSAMLARKKGALVCGLDASQAMLGVARSRVPDGDFRLGDLEILPFDDDTFDVVIGFNSIQFASNPDQAMAEARRVCRPGGTVAIVVWADPKDMEAASLIKALRPLLPSPPPSAPGPFALSDEGALHQLAQAAELRAEGIFDVECPFVYPDEDTALRGLNSSGVAARAMQHAGEQAVREAHANAIAPFRQSDGGFRIGATFRCLVTRA